MKLLFRCDASVKIGTGHLMRCLSIANAAKSLGWKICFVIRDPSEIIIDQISCAGHKICKLETTNHRQNKTLTTLQHGDWLPVSQNQDAQETIDFIKDFNPAWVIVDHYALDSEWHSMIKRQGGNILVIDDLGDRNLSCDLLLDQNLGANPEKYLGKVPSYCKLLLGPDYGLLRSEFREWREKSIKGRLGGKMKYILITMGGVDEQNYTLRVLREIANSKRAKDFVFIVVIGELYPHANSLYEFVETSRLKINVLLNIKNMAELMSKSDLCIGAAGATSLERCCLGLPTISFAIANNQKGVLEQLVKNECSLATSVESILKDFEEWLKPGKEHRFRQLSMKSAQIIDGYGVQRLLDQLERFCD